MRFIILFLFPFYFLNAHPGIGIVRDSKGNIYYTDLKQVWMISGDKYSVIIPEVHTHELYVDGQDRLFGEGEHYNDSTKKFFHFLWMYKGNGNIDTVISMREAYLKHDFSLARDSKGNEYYLKRFFDAGDTNAIYIKSDAGGERVFARGNFGKVNWLHPQDDGTLLYVAGNNLYEIDAAGKIHMIADSLANEKPEFSFAKDPLVWGAWKDANRNFYVAVFSDQIIKRIDSNGVVSVIYKSKQGWTPLHGIVADNEMWLLEGSDKNEVKVSMLQFPEEVNASNKTNPLFFVGAGICTLVGALIFMRIKGRKKANTDVESNN